MITIAVPGRLRDITGPSEEHIAVLELQHQQRRAYMTFAHERDIEDPAMTSLYWQLCGLKRLRQMRKIATMVEVAGLLDVIANDVTWSYGRTGVEGWYLGQDAEMAEDAIAQIIRLAVRVG